MSLSSLSAKSPKSDEESRTFLSRFVTRNVEDLKSLEMWQACIAEFIGVFLLAFFTIGVGISKAGEEPAPLLQGALGTAFFVTVIITALSSVSGGHVNPAISIGFLVTNRISVVRFVLYTLFQSIGGIVGVAFLKAVLPNDYMGNLGLISVGDGVSEGSALAMEIIITGLLLFNTISFTDGYRVDVAGSVPYMVGLTVGVNILTAAKISGGCMNPARALGSAVIVGDMQSQWIYWLGPLIGGIFGAWLYDSFFSTRPLDFIANAIERTKPQDRKRTSSHKSGSETRRLLSSGTDETNALPEESPKRLSFGIVEDSKEPDAEMGTRQSNSV